MGSDAVDQLWGGSIERLEVDLDRHVVELRVQVVDGDVVSEHHVEFSGVHEFRFFSEVPSPWRYAELTSIVCAASSSGGIQTEIELWSHDAGLSIRSAAVSIDGEPVTP